MTKKRTSPADLVGSGSLAKNRRWVDSLSKSDLKYVIQVADRLAEMPEASPIIVARRLKEELGADVAEVTIVRALKVLTDAKS